MKNNEQVMSGGERNPLAELEQVIARGKMRFLEMGLALGIVRDLRLYKREYGSFEQYCQQKLGCTRQHGYRLIRAAAGGTSNLQVSLFQRGGKKAKGAPVTEGQQLVASEVKVERKGLN